MSSSLVHDPKNNTKEKAVANDNKNFAEFNLQMQQNSD